jgi:hypothetical protein
MKILITNGEPLDAFGMDWHPVRYMADAARALNYDVDTVRNVTEEDADSADLILVISSGSFPRPMKEYMQKTAYWFIDNRLPWYRHKCDQEALRALANGGWVFCAQGTDVHRLELIGMPCEALRWLPLAVDTEIYQPHDVEKKHGFLFVGAIYDDGRAIMLQKMQKNFDLAVAEPYTYTNEEAAKLYSSARVVFNVQSFYGHSYAYDTNMRVFEVPASRAILMTSDAPDMRFLGLEHGKNCYVYHSEKEMLALANHLANDVNDAELELVAEEARSWAMGHTYTHRLSEIIQLVLLGESNERV